MNYRVRREDGLYAVIAPGNEELPRKWAWTPKLEWASIVTDERPTRRIKVPKFITNEKTQSSAVLTEYRVALEPLKPGEPLPSRPPHMVKWEIPEGTWQQLNALVPDLGENPLAVLEALLDALEGDDPDIPG